LLLAADVATGSPARLEITLWQTWRDRIGSFDARGIGVGGWSLSPHHVCVPFAHVLSKTLTDQTTTYHYDSLGHLSGVSFPRCDHWPASPKATAHQCAA
jgi:YD repeat-containing protein